MFSSIAEETKFEKHCAGRNERRDILYIRYYYLRGKRSILPCDMLIYTSRRSAFLCSIVRGSVRANWHDGGRETKRERQRDRCDREREWTINTKIRILFYKCWLLLNVEYCSAESSRAFVWEINLCLKLGIFIRNGEESELFKQRS